MFITAFTLTCNRPELLSRAIKCFERQTYAAKDRYLIILDDLGQYDNQKGDRWELISLPRRALTLGEKNNIAIALMPPETEAIAKLDDDDFAYPHWLSAHAEALSRGNWVQPRHAIDWHENHWVQMETYHRSDPTSFAYHSAWAYRRDLFCKLGGYKAEFAGDDGELQRRWKSLGAKSVDIKGPPFYQYNRPLSNRISEMGAGAGGYKKLGENIKFIGKVPVWTDESDWLRPIPTEIVRRPW